MTNENNINPLIFRAYDIRGIVGEDLTEETVELIGKGIGTFFIRNNAQKLSVGRDVRLSSEPLKNALARGILSTGCDIIDTGVSSSPILNSSIMLWGLDGGVMVTGSHNPIQFNGIKLTMKGGLPVSSENIQEIRKIIETGDFEKGNGSISEKSAVEEYFQSIQKVIKLERPMKVAVDTGNGVGGLFIPQLLRRLGCEVVELYTEPDGNFPNHIPNPETQANLADLEKIVAEQKCDVGFGYDGDADRMGLVDETGTYREADYIIMLLSRDYLTRHPGEKILIDVKVSQNVINDIRKHGGEPFLYKVGYSLIKRKMSEENILLGGELSGHIFAFEDFFPFDDGLYASCRVLQYLSKSNKTVSEHFTDLPKLFSTRLIEIPVPDDRKFDVIKGVTAKLSEKYSIVDIDGVRAEFPDGWTIVRASNTTPNLTVRFEANTQEALDRIQSEVYSILRMYPEVNLNSIHYH
ncbi:phosphomannomutase/phosphoglucomutase [candidate division KSB1 bacterium]|nr:phosphomannomutase/phosphoglucomutase [candidate division KSB1 bacterium]